MNYRLSALYLAVSVVAGLYMLALVIIAKNGPILLSACLGWLILFVDAVVWWAARTRRRSAHGLIWIQAFRVAFATLALGGVALTLRNGVTDLNVTLGHLGYLGWAALYAWFFFYVRIADSMLLGDLVRAWRLERPKIQVANLYSLLLSVVVLFDAAVFVLISAKGVAWLLGEQPEVLLGFANGIFLLIFVIVGPLIPMLVGVKRTVGANCFLSYASEDAGLVDKIREGLETRDIGCFHDKRNVLGGDELGMTIGRGIATSDVFLVVLSHASLASPWVRDEAFLAFHYERMNGAPTVIPMRICSMESIEEWKGAGDDVAAKIRARSITNFEHPENSWDRSIDQLAEVLREKAIGRL